MNSNSNNFTDSIAQKISKFVRQATTYDEYKPVNINGVNVNMGKNQKVLIRDLETGEVYELSPAGSSDEEEGYSSSSSDKNTSNLPSIIQPNNVLIKNDKDEKSDVDIKEL